MFKKILVIIGVVAATHANTQTTQASKIQLAVKSPASKNLLTDAQLMRIGVKTEQLASASGFAASADAPTLFAIEPQFQIVETFTQEGMQNITVTKVDFSLVIKNISDKTVFANINKQLIGSGASEVLSLENAITKINASDKDLKSAIEKGKSKIIDYYNNKCTEIIANSQSLVGVKKYEQALALLFAVPQEATPCFEKVQEKLLTAFNLYNNQTCQAKLTEAKALIANRDFENALAVLSEIDPTSNCAAELKSVISSTASKVDAVDKREWDLVLQKQKDETSIAQARAEAMGKVAEAYYRSQQTIINPTIIR